MGTYIKAASGNNLNTTAAWLENGVPPATVPDDRDGLWWTASPVLSLGGNLIGGALCDGIIMDGASADITWNPTTAGTAITFQTLVNNSTSFLQRRPNNRQWVSGANGQFALGSLDRTFRLFNSTGNVALYFAGNRLTGTGTLTLENGGDPTDSAYLAVFGSNQTLSSFTGNVVLSARVLVGAGRVGSGMFPNSNMTVNGENCVLIPFDASGDILGAASRTLTINSNNISLGYASRGWSISYVVALGSTKRTLEILGYTALNSNVTGSNGFIKTGTSGLVFQAATNSLSGQISINAGYIGLGIFNSGNANVLPNLTGGFDFGASGGNLTYYGTSAFTENRPITVSSGNTNNYVQATLNNTITFGAASLIASYPGWVILSGDETITSSAMSFGTNVPVAAAGFAGHNYNTTNGIRTYLYTWGSSNPSTIQGYIDLYSHDNTTGNILELQDNGTGETTFSNALAVNKWARATFTSSSQTVRFSGSNPSVIVNGTITQTLNGGTLNVQKSGTGTWTLTNSGNYTGLTTVSGGTLKIQHDLALGSTSAGDITLSGGTLRLEGVNRSITKTARTLTFGGGTLEVAADSGAASLSCGPVTITGNNGVVNVESGSSFGLNNTGLITGSLGLIKNGAGSFSLPSMANTFTGVFNVNGGDVTIGSIANSGSGASWGAGSSPVKVPKNLKINGTGGTTNRPVMFVGSTPSIESAGAGTVTFSATSQGGGDRTITLKGDNVGDNTFSGPLKESGLYQSMPLNVARGRHSSITLQNGKVLILGGTNNTSAFSSCELYDPATESWSTTGAMSSARWYCDDNAVLLNNGKVLVVGGTSTSSASSATTGCELYDPSLETWSVAASITTARTHSSIVKLNDGRVLMAGGYGTATNALNTCQIYTQNEGTGTWTTNTPSFTGGRVLHTTTLMSNGSVLLVGGWTSSASLNTFQIFDPAGGAGAGSWNTSSTFSANTRYGHIAVPIFNKTKVLIAGGAVNSNTTGNTYSTCLIYDVTSGWTSAAPMNVGRYRPTYQVLSDGRVFVAGGSGNDGQSINTAEIYDPIADTWTLLPDTLASIASWPVSSTLSLANDNRILISGGYNSSSTVTNICNTYNPTQTLALTKSGSGKWILGGDTLSYSGTTSIEEGTLDLGGTSRVLSGGITMSGGTLQNGSATLESNITVSGTSAINAKLAGAKSLNITGGIVTVTQDDSNAHSGGTTISAGATLKAITAVDPSAVPGGKALGEGTVTVSGTLKTGSSSTQRGQLRYGGTLTFNGGSKIYLGGA